MLLWTGQGLRFHPKSEIKYNNESKHEVFIFLLDQ